MVGKDRVTEKNRLLPVLLCLIAAGCFGYAVFAKTWLYNPRTEQLVEVGFGLTSNFMCKPTVGGGSECRSLSNGALLEEWKKLLAEAKKEAEGDPSNPVVQRQYLESQKMLKTSSSFPIWGYVTLVALAIAVLSLVTAAVLALMKKRILWPVMPTTGAILGTAIGLITGCVFVATKPGPPGFVGTGYGFYAFGAGVLCGIAGAIMINKFLRPIDPDLLADTMDPEHY